MQSMRSTSTTAAPLPVRLAVRGNPSNPNANIWLNKRGRNSGGIWHIDYVLYDEKGQRQRPRFSLQTKDVVQARLKRDAILAQLVARYPQPPKRPARPRRLAA